MKRTFLALTLPLVAIALHSAQADVSPDKNCVPVGGTVSTNFGVIDDATTLGLYTGDLAGAVSARILSQAPGPNGTVILTVQHYSVTESGDTILYAPATLTGKEIAPGRLAVLDYPVRIIGGTGKYDGATGSVNAIGVGDFGLGQASMRYTGKVCFKK